MSTLLAHLRYCVSDAADEWRHSPGPNVLATATLAAVLFVAGVNLVVLTNVSARVGNWKSDLRVSVYLRDAAEGAEVDALYAKLAALPGVARIERVDKAEALRRFQASFKDLADVPSELDTNPLPASLEVVLDPGPRARDTAQAVGTASAGLPAVDEVRYDQDFLDRLDGLLDVARWSGSLLALVVAIAVAFVVAGVLRLTVLARRDEIAIMHLVGAPPMLVRGPFLVAGVTQGLAGALLALFLVEATRRGIAFYTGGATSGLIELAAGNALPAVPSLVIVGAGAALGFASAWFAVRDANALAL
jgi:cell division transport system permease protein